jgi:hypothetical protein
VDVEVCATASLLSMLVIGYSALSWEAAGGASLVSPNIHEESFGNTTDLLANKSLVFPIRGTRTVTFIVIFLRTR